MKQTLTNLLVPGLLALVCSVPAWADTNNATSEKKIVKQILSGGGVKGHSTTFTEVGTFGETFVGVRQSSTYTVSQGFWNPEKAASCCVGFVGNIDCDLNDDVDIVDLTRLIDHLFISFSPLCCTAEAYFGPEAAGSPITATYHPDIAAVTAMLDHLFISFAALPPCSQ